MTTIFLYYDTWLKALSYRKAFKLNVFNLFYQREVYILRSKGQFAMEHILTIAFAMLIIIPVTYMFYTYSDSQSNELIFSRVNTIGHKIVDNCESIYYLGEPSRITLKENFPDKIMNISIEPTTKRELLFYLTDQETELVFISNTPMSGPYYVDENQLCSGMPAIGNPCYSAGIKNIIIKASATESQIIIS